MSLACFALWNGSWSFTSYLLLVHGLLVVACVKGLGHGDAKQHGKGGNARLEVFGQRCLVAHVLTRRPVQVDEALDERDDLARVSQEGGDLQLPGEQVLGGEAVDA